MLGLVIVGVALAIFGAALVLALAEVVMTWLVMRDVRRASRALWRRRDDD